MRRHWLVLLLIMFAVGGCSGGQATKTEGEVRIWVHESGLFAGGMDAIVTGALAYDRADRCMYLALGESLDPVVWPAGTKIVGQDPVVLRVRGGLEVTEGDIVSGGGGYVSIRQHDELIPPECSGTQGQVAEFNADSNIEMAGG